MLLTAFVKFVRVLLVGVMSLSFCLSPLTGDKLGKIEDAKDNCNASFAVISDLHLKDNFIRQGMLELGFDDMANAGDRLDAVVFDGDITDHGYIDMWDCFARAVAKYDMADQYVIVTGNHDTWGPDRDNIETVKQTFIDYNKKISNRDISEMYYTTTIGKYPVIVLGSEEDHTNATISQKQIDWLAQEMENASKTGLPIFVFLHQPINQTHGLPYNWEMDETDPLDEGGIGDASDAIFDILKKYNNVFYISGHIHSGFSNADSGNKYVSVEEKDGVHLINVPCYEYPDVVHGGNITNGTGYLFEVYDDEVMIRARNFAMSTWCTKYDVTIPLTK